MSRGFQRAAALLVQRGSMPTSASLEHAKHIQLRNVPYSAKPSDIRRAVTRAGLQGISDVAVEYDRFSPTGDALITLTGPDFLRDSLRLLERLTIAGTPVSAKQKIVIEGRQRTRGTKGRAEAEERGLIGGNGPHAGSLTKTGRMAVIWGFPGKMTADVVSQHFKDFKMERSGRDKVSVRRVPLPNDAFSMFSRFVVTLESVSEAHRLVRDVHMTYLNPEAFGTRYRLYAHIVY